MKSGWWRHRYRQGLLVDVGNILYRILRNIFHPFSMSLHSVLLLKQQISFARMVQLWRAGNGILILTSLSEQRPRHDVCGISDRVCGDMQSILHACVRFLSLLNCSQMMKIMSSPAPKRFSDTPNPKATHCLLFAVCFVLINNYVRALTTSTPLTVNLAIISSIRQGSLVLEIFSMVISSMLPIHCEDVHLAPHHGSHIHVIHHAEHDSWCTQIKKCAFVVFIFSF